MSSSSLPVPLLQLNLSEAILKRKTDRVVDQAIPSLPVPNPTRSYWLHHDESVNTLAKQGSDGGLSADADVCIIGSGVTGISAAYHLAKRFGSHEDAVKMDARHDGPLSVVVLEARDFCSGATGRNGGHLVPAAFLDFAKRASEFGPQEAKKIYDIEARTALEVVELIRDENLSEQVDLMSGGRITLLLTEEEERRAREDYNAAQDAGLDMQDVAWFTKEEMNSTHGTPYPAVRFPGHNLYPLKLVTALYNLALKQQHPTSFKLDLHTNTPVTVIAHVGALNSKRRWKLTTPRGDILCSYVIHATNGYAGYLLPHMRGPDGVVPTRGQVMALRADAPFPELAKASWTSNEDLEYWFPRPLKKDNEEDQPLVILGGAREVRSGFEFHLTDDSVVDPDVGRALREFLPALFPGQYASHKEPEIEWTGIMGFTKSGAPFVGPVVIASEQGREIGNKSVLNGQYISAGYNGHGMPRAYSCAEVIADMVAADIAGVKWEVPKWLPNHFLTYTKI